MNDTLLVALDGSVLPDRSEIGGKAWSIARMRRLGLPVPPAVVLTVAACHEFHAGGGVLSEACWAAVRRGVADLEKASGRSFGAGPEPLLLSVRSGAAVSMPGMMDTVLDLGVNDEVEAALAAATGDAGYARDTHRRFVESYGRIVCRADIEAGTGADAVALRRAVLDDCGAEVPEDPWEQLHGAVAAVFASWHSRRATAYRRHWGIGEDGGTAVTLQAMVFGNLDDRSGTGVLFTRDPATGGPDPYGEWLPRGQGEDVVSGSHTPLRLDDLARTLPQVHRALVDAGRVLERESGDAQDVEFTVQRGTLYLLQSRTAKRSPGAAVRMAIDLVDEGVLKPRDAVRRVSAAQLRALLRPRIDRDARGGARVLAKGLAACPGVAQGTGVLGAARAEERAGTGEPVVLLAEHTSPEDVSGMIAAQGVCTETGGSTSHAAVVGRALGRPSVVGCGDGALAALDGRPVTVDGDTGEVLAGMLPLCEVRADADPDLARLAEWAAQAAPLAAVRPDAAPEGAVDLDAAGVVEPEGIAAAARGAAAASGAVLETDAGVAAALAAGVRTVVVAQPLPTLLAAIAASTP